MPSNAAINEQTQQDHTQGQVKLCSSCQRLLTVELVNATFFDSTDATNVCTSCRDQMLSERMSLGDPYRFCDENESQVVRRVPRIAPAYDLALLSHNGTHIQDERPLGDDVDMSEAPTTPATPSMVSPEPVTPFRRPQTYLSSVSNQHMTLRIVCDTDLPSTRIPGPQASALGTSSHLQPRKFATSSPDPLVDITRIRIRSRGHHCLYPGASFQGTQKSGRNSYDVNVTIVDVDFTSSFLCGYLRIRGLTDDWPELTTYFDAEIIGSKYGFLTQDWGANEQEDMVHWQRFPAFRHVKHELKKPHLTMSDRDRGAVFMRWKERFLVPDHRVQDINGASFAGFYYVCVDFNPQPAAPATRPVTQSMSSTPESDECISPPLPAKGETPQAIRIRRDSSAKRGGRAPSVGPRSATPVPTMSGFYFHQNSEPYQQLSLNHVPERTSSSFEFR